MKIIDTASDITVTRKTNFDAVEWSFSYAGDGHADTTVRVKLMHDSPTAYMWNWPANGSFPEGTEAIELRPDEVESHLYIIEFARHHAGWDRLRSLPEPPATGLAGQIEQWWFERASEEIERTVPKAIEYGSFDLIEIGRDLAHIVGREVDDQEAAELGVYFYLKGKMARWGDAIRQGRRVSDDTLFDIGIYVRMAQRIRHSGSWPGVEQ